MLNMLNKITVAICGFNVSCFFIGAFCDMKGPLIAWFITWPVAVVFIVWNTTVNARRRLKTVKMGG